MSAAQKPSPGTNPLITGWSLSDPEEPGVLPCAMPSIHRSTFQNFGNAAFSCDLSARPISQHRDPNKSRRNAQMNPLRAIIILSAFLAPAALTTAPATAATRHYDCSKAANANKTACKNPSNAGAATPSRTVTTTAKSTTTSRHYDCTKAGNATKPACRTAGAQTATGSSPGAVKTTTTSSATTTDCTKWFNKARAACRTSTSSSPPRTTVAPAAKPTAANSSPAATPHSSKSAANSNAQGATAQCKDGTFSHAAHHAGACSHHGGVAKWMN